MSSFSYIKFAVIFRSLNLYTYLNMIYEGMQHEGLFSRAISGTKMIVEQYHESVAYALDFICDSQVRHQIAIFISIYFQVSFSQEDIILLIDMFLSSSFYKSALLIDNSLKLMYLISLIY